MSNILIGDYAIIEFINGESFKYYIIRILPDEIEIAQVDDTSQTLILKSDNNTWQIKDYFEPHTAIFIKSDIAIEYYERNYGKAPKLEAIINSDHRILPQETTMLELDNGTLLFAEKNRLIFCDYTRQSRIKEINVEYLILDMVKLDKMIYFLLLIETSISNLYSLNLDSLTVINIHAPQIYLNLSLMNNNRLLLSNLDSIDILTLTNNSFVNIQLNNPNKKSIGKWVKLTNGTMVAFYDDVGSNYDGVLLLLNDITLQISMSHPKQTTQMTHSLKGVDILGLYPLADNKILMLSDDLSYKLKIATIYDHDHKTYKRSASDNFYNIGGVLILKDDRVIFANSKEFKLFDIVTGQISLDLEFPKHNNTSHSYSYVALLQLKNGNIVIRDNVSIKVLNFDYIQSYYDKLHYQTIFRNYGVYQNPNINSLPNEMLSYIEKFI